MERRLRLSDSDRLLLVRVLASLIENSLQQSGKYYDGGWRERLVDWDLINHAYRLGLALGKEGKGRRERGEPAWLGYEVKRLGTKDPVKELRELGNRIELAIKGNGTKADQQSSV